MQDKLLRMLILGENHLDTGLIIELLKREDWQIQTRIATNMNDFRKYLNEFDPDIVLSDCNLPEYSGLDILKFCKEIKPFTPVIFLTQALDIITAVNCLKLGAWNCVRKDYISELASEVREAIEYRNKKIKEKLAQVTINESEIFLRQLLDKLQIAVILIDRDLKLIYFNHKAEEITGINFKTWLGKNIFDALRFNNERGQKLDPHNNFISIALETSKTVQNIICTYTCPDGEELWLSACATPMEAGEKYKGIDKIIISLQDVTQNQEIEAFLKDTEIRYETVFNTVNDGIFLYETEEFRPIDVNDRVVEMYGYSKQELKKLQIADLSVKEEGFTNLCGIKYALKAMSGEVQIHEWHARNKSGCSFWTRLLLKKVIIGDFPYLMGIIKDIDDQKKAELSLRESEEHYRALAQNSPDVIMRFDRNFRHLFVNDTVRNVIPLEPKDFINKTHNEIGIFTDEMCQFWETHINKVFVTGKPDECEFSIDSPGKMTFIEWRLFPEYNSSGQISTVLAVARDITEKKESEVILRKNEERLHLALEATSDGIWDWDLKNDNIYFSPRYLTMLGYQPEEIEHSMDAFYNLIHPDEREKVIKDFEQKSIIKQDNLKVELRLRRKDGSYAWIEVRGKVFVKDEKGFPVRVVGANIDITHRKKQEAIRNVLIDISDAVNTTRNLDEFFESIQLFLGGIIDTKNCYIALYEKKTHTITLPFHRDEKDKFKEFPAGKSVTAYVIKTGKSQLLSQQKINKLIESGDIEIIGTPAVSWLGVPLKIEEKLIGVFVVQSYDKNIQYDEGDVQILEFVSDQIALAIARKKDQDNIRENQERQRQIIESSPEGLVVTSKEGVILDHNSRIREMFQCKRKELKHRNLLDFITPGDRQNMLEIFKKVLISGFQNYIEIRMAGDDQTEFFAEISIGLIRKANDMPESFVINIKNIDERKAYELNLKIAKEKAEESDKLKTAFLSNMSHEIRTPMNAIIGFAELLSHTGVSDEEKKEFISQINYGAESLMRIIDDIIDIAKIEAGQIKIYNSYFNLSLIFGDLKLMFSKNLYRQNKQHLQLIEDNNGINAGIQLYGDQIRIRQVLNNLINNAIKFTETGEVRFGVKEIRDGYIRFYIRDTGIGISAEKLEIIFDRFRQGHESRTKYYGGTGLGLAISKYLVELMGGKIRVSSEKGNGSEFSFSIPYQTLEDEIKEASIYMEMIEVNWENKIILIAEDEASNFLLLKEMLKWTNVKILWARDGKEVVEMFSANPKIDLILMDVQLPFRNGYEATKIIKALKADIPVIAQTSYAMSGEKQESMRAGCDDYISKPIKIRELVSLMSKFLTDK